MMTATTAQTSDLPVSVQSPSTHEPLCSPLKYLDYVNVSAAAKAESRNREVHLPPVSTYRWWARRTSAVNGAVIDAFNRMIPGRLLVADMFAGGGVIPLAAVVRGHQVYAQDLNPWPAAGLTAMLSLPEPEKLRKAAATIQQYIRTAVDTAYGTTLKDGTEGVVSHTVRVATGECTGCGARAKMFPHALVSLLVRKESGKPDAWLACHKGHLFKASSDKRQRCPECQSIVDPSTIYTPKRTITCECGKTDRLADRSESWQWEIVLVERSSRVAREIDLPTQVEHDQATRALRKTKQDLGPIPPGRETNVLIRHGFKRWEDLYPERQRQMLERMLELAGHCSDDPSVVRAVELAVIGSAEMAGHLSRWDRYYLKSYEAMAGHRFNLTTLAVEPNVWGGVGRGRGSVLRRLNQLVKSATWLHEKTGRGLLVEGPVPCASTVTPLGEWDVRVVEGSSERMVLPSQSVHLALTDPPYHDDVQYAELSAPLRAWQRKAHETLTGEAVVNATTGQLTNDGAYENLLSKIFAEVRRTLRPDGHLIFSYANRSPHAWTAVFGALQSAGMRAVGCEIVHSENETDHAKRGVRACTLDLMLDLVPSGEALIEQHRPEPVPDLPLTDERRFLDQVSEIFLRVGSLQDGWREDAYKILSAHPFIGKPNDVRPERVAREA
ncbi:hypothetical protein KIF24_31150 [Micromonospora sp. Llam7]|uniref:hypothetical protein n=1 Tax=Micromonospora tarapacensis TaxID=2835305 RepID=UPI001C82FA8A|nr:hypothetical protein [Micromonospora tarapacensis]MBX7270041.1 hypothetical protein [Micromonospora tarapacensis]